MRETGFLQVDVEYDFLRARRRQVLAALAHRLRRWRGDGNRLVPLDEVAGPASWRGERQLGRQTIRLDTIIGTAGPRRDFDRRFRPASNRVRFRWERLALAQRRGEPIPPVEVYRVGGCHFVIDGHHRISIAAASGERLIEAYVTQVLTAAPSGPDRSPVHEDRPARFRMKGPDPGDAVGVDGGEHLIHPAAGDAGAVGQAQQVVAGPAAAVHRLGIQEGAHLAHGCRQVAGFDHRSTANGMARST